MNTTREMFPHCPVNHHKMCVEVSVCRYYAYIIIQLHAGSSPPELKLKDLVLLVTNDWYSLGLQLDIEDSKLEEIQKDSNGSSATAKRMMFQLWLRIETCTNKHEKLIKAFELVDGPNVAETIASKLMKK